MSLIALTIAQILFGVVIVGTYVLLGFTIYKWFSNIRNTREAARLDTSWNYDHQFFETITEFRNDFSGK